MGKQMVRTVNLTKKYGEFTAVNGLNLEVDRGEIFGLIGPNGAGKTTTIRMLMGILKATDGTAYINDLDCFRQRAEVMRSVGYLPDEPTYYTYLRGRELIQFAGEMHGLTKSDINQRAGELVERLDLDQALEEFPMNYSTGMKKKLGLILALLHDPDLLILDEPINGLDPYAIRTVYKIIQEEAEIGRSVFFSTHLLDQAEKLCTRVGIFFKGQLAALGSLEELKGIDSQMKTLEDVFFKVTAEPTL